MLTANVVIVWKWILLFTKIIIILVLIIIIMTQ